MAGQGILDLFKAKKREPKKNPALDSARPGHLMDILADVVEEAGLERVLRALSSVASHDESVDEESLEKIQGVLLVLSDIAAGEDVDDEEIDEDEDEDLDEDDLPEEAEDDESDDESGDE